VKNSIAIVVSSPMMINFFLIKQIKYLSDFFSITILTSLHDNDISLLDLPRGVKVRYVNIERKVSVFKDLTALLILSVIFIKARFDLVYSVSPKAGFLSQIAAKISFTKVRVHMFTGQVWATKLGISRFMLKMIDKIIAALSTKILIDSYSQRSFLISEGVVTHENSSVLLNGSISGIDPKKFTSSRQQYEDFRIDQHLKKESKIILYIGRLTFDKGIIDMIKAFDLIGQLKDTYLVLVGPDEDNIMRRVDNYIVSNRDKVLYFDYTSTPQTFFQAADVLCLPSYREGFGNVIIEAAMCGLPAVASNVYGLVDSMSDQETGLVFDVGDVSGLAACLKKVLTDDSFRKKTGLIAKNRTQKYFDDKLVNHELVVFFNNLMQ